MLKSNYNIDPSIDLKKKLLKNKLDIEAPTTTEVESTIEESNPGYINKSKENNNFSIAKQAVKNKYYRAGNFDIIQHANYKIEKAKEKLAADLENIVSQSGTYNSGSGTYSKDNSIDFKKYNQLVKDAKKLNVVLPDSKSITIDNLPNLVQSVRASNPNRIEGRPEKYGYTREEFDAEINKNIPVDNGLVGAIENGTAVVGETPEEKIVNQKAAAAKAAQDAKILAEKNKPFDNTELLNKFNDDGMFSDPKFQYTPGEREIPFDALIGLTTGLIGATAADDVDIKYRDEQISEGMLQYAQDIAKIKNMGLDPSIEAGLKMKLADAYQTGLDNIVRASNGNRNLVLGNQGQLDKARMNGVVEIAAMDVDRTDKAMAAFGEVQQYINEFESRKDISNNERQYGEDKQKQVAGAQLAQQGMSSFIDAIQNAKENGPGSMNDMRRQMFQFNATGILPNAKPGEIGSAEYKETKKVEAQLFQTKKRTYADWINSKNRDEQDIINNILQKNPQLNPNINKQTEFSELEKLYNDVSGTDEYKSEYQKSKGISELTTNNLETKADEMLGKTPKETPVKEKKYLENIDDPIQIMPITTAPLPSTSKQIVKDKYSPVIVTSEKLPNATLTQQLANGANNKPTGVNSIDPVVLENQKRMDNAMNQIDEINKAAAEREIIFNQKQAESEQRLNSLMQ